MNVGLLGFGAVGSGVAEAIHNGKAGSTRLVAVLEADAERITPSVLAKYEFKAFRDLSEFLRTDMELVVEGAGAAALRQCALPILRAGKDLMTLSVSAFGMCPLRTSATIAADATKAATMTGMSLPSSIAWSIREPLQPCSTPSRRGRIR